MIGSSDIVPTRPSGVLVIDKPQGLTSHDVVAGVRRALAVRDVGHAGTLDPMATGVLVVVLGEATKLSPWLTAQDKTYRATVALGVETDTLDADGVEVRRESLGPLLRAALGLSLTSTPVPALLAALDAERARAAQQPPAHSAIHLDGERAFARARRGEAVALPSRPVRVGRLDLVGCSVDPARVELVLEVSKGYYVRALARDFAAALGTVGHLSQLRRTRSGAFSLDEATRFDAPPAELRARIQSLATVAGRALPQARLTEAGVLDARHGRQVQPGDIRGAASGPSAWLDPQGTLVAVGELDAASGRGRVLRGFNDVGRT